MEVVLPPFADVWIEPEESDAVKSAMRRAGHDQWAEEFSGAALGRLLEAWQHFVGEDWTRWDSSEYYNEIQVRDKMAIVLQALAPASRDRLVVALEPLDAGFRARMRPTREDEPGVEESRFWMSNTIWNTCCE